MKNLESQRLIIRETVFADCECFAEWETNPAVTQFFTIDEGRSYQDVVTEFVARQEDSTKVQMTVCLKPENQPVGRIYISNIDDHYDSLDITRIYIADPSMRGQGYGEEALRSVVKWAFEEMNMERVTLDHFTGNQIAHNLYRKVGFQPEGCMRHGGKKNGEYIDLNLMSILREEYEQQK